jgi:hypothetical protein
VTTAVEARAVPTVDDELQTLSVDIQISNRARAENFQITSIRWQAAGHTEEMAVNNTVEAGTRQSIPIKIEDLGEQAIYGRDRSFNATVIFADRPSLRVTRNISINPIWHHAPNIDGNLTTQQDLPAIDSLNDTTWNCDGPNTIDTSMWLTHDEEHLYVSAKVEDDIHHQTRTGRTTWRADSIQFAIASPGADQFVNFNMALGPDGPDIFQTYQPSKTKQASLNDVPKAIVRHEDRNTTIYEVAFPWSRLPVEADDDVIQTAFIVNDNDDEGGRCWKWWGSDTGISKDVGEFRTAHIVDNDGAGFRVRPNSTAITDSTNQSVTETDVSTATTTTSRHDQTAANKELQRPEESTVTSAPGFSAISSFVILLLIGVFARFSSAR